MISCIVPVFNGERYLSEALDSILQQTYTRHEIIVVDDGSTDATPAVAARYGRSVRYIRQDNRGPQAARNAGVSSAQAEFIAFLDSDDVWHPAKLERQIACFGRRPELDLCVTKLQNFWAPELADEAARLKHHRLAQPLPGYVTDTLLARRALFDRVGPFAPGLRFGDDTDWFLRAAECSAVMELLPEVLVYRRIHGRNISMERGGARMSGDMRDGLFEVLKLSLERRRGREAVVPARSSPCGSRGQDAARSEDARSAHVPAVVGRPVGGR
jgi:glycosyltransferase involved in cell wall biosynthesis